MERLHKFLARAGIASRRKSEALLLAGRVRVNGQKVILLGSKVDPEHDLIEVDGKAVAAPREYTYILVNKPTGYVSTARDPQGRPTVLELVKARERLYPVGRLDVDSEGLVLLNASQGRGPRASGAVDVASADAPASDAHIRGCATAQV